MTLFDRIPNEQLVAAGLKLMEENGKPLTRIPTKGRAMIYRTENGETVRIRTCNDHLLVILADRDEADARLNVEGTDHVLIVMPETQRTHGPIAAYLVPASIVVDAARTTHRNWLATNPNTKGDNRTWNLWFDESGPAKANGYAEKWAKYRLPGNVSTIPKPELPNPPAMSANGLKLGDVIAIAKRQIAEVAGVSPDAVRISIDLA